MQKSKLFNLRSKLLGGLSLCLILILCLTGLIQPTKSKAANENPFSVNDVVKTSAGDFFVYDIQASGRILFMACGAAGTSQWASYSDDTQARSLVESAETFASKFTEKELVCMESRGGNTYFGDYYPTTGGASKLLPLNNTDLAGSPNGTVKNPTGIKKYIANGSNFIYTMGTADGTGIGEGYTRIESVTGGSTCFWSSSFTGTNSWGNALAWYVDVAPSTPALGNTNNNYARYDWSFVPAFTIAPENIQTFYDSIKPKTGTIKLTLKELQEPHTVIPNATFNLIKIEEDTETIIKQNLQIPISGGLLITDVPLGKYKLKQTGWTKAN